MSAERKTIRFEDLGEPVQRLLKSLKGGVTEEDMALLEYVGVKDMKTIYEKMSSDASSTEIWNELKEALQTRKAKAERKTTELSKKQEDIDSQLEAQRKAEEEERLAQEREAEERRKRKEERRKEREEQRIAEEEAAEQERLEEEARQQEEAEEKRREAKRKRREARARELAEEQEALRLEQEKHSKAKKKNQKKEWDDYVASHPLDFAPQTTEIKQVEVVREQPPPPKADDELLNRSYTPKCPNCCAKFSRPPPEWDCPICMRRLRQHFKVWQPDADTQHCMCCKGGIGRFNRHHCRNCGRVVCSKCSTLKAVIPSIGYKDAPVKVCQECVDELGKTVPAE